MMSESIALPFTQLTPMHPGLELGVTIRERTRKNSITQLSIAAGGFYHKKVVNAFYLKSSYLFSPIILSLLTFDIEGSLGYMHTFYPGEVYELNEQSGEFEKTSQYGRPNLMAGLGLGFTFIKSRKLHPFARYELSVGYPNVTDWPLMLHSLLKVGLFYRFDSK